MEDNVLTDVADPVKNDNRRILKTNKVTQTMADTRIVLIAVDPSDHAERAFKFYLDNLHRPENEVIFYHVAERPNLSSVSLKEPMSFPSEEWEKEVKRRNEDISSLETDYETTRISKQIKGKFRTVYDDTNSPGDAIVKAADENNATMIVMGTRGLGKIRRTILGSVSDYVVHHSKCTVVIGPKSD